MVHEPAAEKYRLVNVSMPAGHADRVLARSREGGGGQRIEGGRGERDAGQRSACQAIAIRVAVVSQQRPPKTQAIVGNQPGKRGRRREWFRKAAATPFLAGSASVKARAAPFDLYTLTWRGLRSRAIT